LNSRIEKKRLEDLHRKFNVVFEAAGGRAQKTTLHEAIDLLKPSGRCVVLGISKDEVPIAVTDIVNKGLTLKGTTRSRMEHYMKALELLKTKAIKNRISKVISKRSFVIHEPRDIEEAFRFADTEEGEAKLKPGRVLLYFPKSLSTL
jgi:ribitol-5-phosphate 2-dehydrogenase